MTRRDNLDAWLERAARILDEPPPPPAAAAGTGAERTPQPAEPDRD